MTNFPIGLSGLIAVAAIIYVARAMRIVRQFEKGLVETFGQFSRKADAGRHRERRCCPCHPCGIATVVDRV